MRSPSKFLLIAAVGAAASSAHGQGAPFTRDVLAAHNAARAAVGVQPLRWDPALAVAATRYAAWMARTGQLVHAPREGRGIARENLLRAPIGYSPAQMMGEWLEERRLFVPGVFPNVSRTGRWFDVSHYTQMIWPTTTAIGCGFVAGRGSKWLVCRYSPGGNKDGKRVPR